MFLERDAQSQSPRPGAMRRVYTITHTHTSDSPRRIPLVDLVVRYHLAIWSIPSIFHKHIYILSSSPLGAILFKYILLLTFLRTNKPDIR